MIDPDRALGALLGAAVGDALGMPITGLSHQNVRTYYKGIKVYRADEHRRDLGAGQWTAHTQRTFALVRVLTAAPHDLLAANRRIRGELAALDLRREESDVSVPTSAFAACAAPLGLVWAAQGMARTEALLWVTTLGLPVVGRRRSLAAGFGQAYAVGEALSLPGDLNGPSFLTKLRHRIEQAEDRHGGDHSVSRRLGDLVPHLDEFPLDLQDRCNGTGSAADEAFPFAVAMFARNPDLVEATLLAALNAGGDASAIGAITGALLGAYNGWSAFPAEWRQGLEDVERLEDEALRLIEALG
jgi:ADP-ribosyl-[dinitrogen reductase] hydrolase